MRLRAEPSGWARPLRGGQSGEPGAARPWMWPVVGLACECSVVWAGRCAWDVGAGFGVRAGCWLTILGSGRCAAQAALPGVAFVPYAGAVPDGGRRGFEAAVAPSEPPSSSGLGHRPFKAAARVQIPLGALCWPGGGEQRIWSCRAAWSARHPVKVEVAGSNPVRTALAQRLRAKARSGSSVGMSVRLKSGRSAVRPRP